MTYTPAQLQTAQAALRELIDTHRFTAEHAIHTLPPPEVLLGYAELPDGQSQLLAEMHARERRIQDMRDDPLRHGYEMEWWGDARRLLTSLDELVVLAGNDSGKSWFGAKYGVECLVSKPEQQVAFMHSTIDSSKIQQQRLVHMFLPPEWRNLGKQGKMVDVTYSRQTGFKDNRFTLPNDSQGFFFFYRQEVGVLTGYKLNAVVADELMPLGHLEEILTRMLGRGGKFLLTFTPKEGYSPTVAKYVAGARIVDTRPAKFLPGKNFDNRPEVPIGHMPTRLQCLKPTAGVLLAFTEWSPFRKPGDLENTLSGKSKADVKVIAYGWADKTIGNAFPRFSQSVNVIARNRDHPWNGVGVVPPRPWEGRKETAKRGDGETETPALYPRLPKQALNYRVADPGGNKNWFIKWYRVSSEPPFVHVYREWPPASTHGPWAEAGDKPDGRPGPGQRFEFDPSIIRYKEIVLQAEGWKWDGQKWDGREAEEIETSLIDSRMGGAPVPTIDDGTSIIEMMEEEQTDHEGRVIGPSMLWYPAPGGHGAIANLRNLEILNHYFHYKTDEPVTILNCPRWYVVGACEQSIFAYQEYTGADGEKGALKDVLDPDWYLVTAGLADEGQLAEPETEKTYDCD